MAKAPNRPVGTVPGSDFADTGDPFGIKVATITRVDEINLKVDIKILTGGGDRNEVELTQGLCGPRSFWGGIPEVGSLVLIGYRRLNKKIHTPVILGYIPVGNRSGLRFDPFSSYNPANVTPDEAETVSTQFSAPLRYKRMRLNPGDAGGMSSSGAEFALTKSVSMYNRAGDFIEIRDEDRTLVTQTIHRSDNASGVREYNGPIRRGDFWIPPDIFSRNDDGSVSTLYSEKEKYFGRDNLQNTGPPGYNNKLADSDGKLLSVINDWTEFPPVTFSSSRRVFYPSTRAATCFEAPDGFGSNPYVEHRIELDHTTDMTQEVLADTDGFGLDSRAPYIEHVMGTLVGNNAYVSTMHMRNYARVLKPTIFSTFWDSSGGQLKLEEVDRNPMEPDVEVDMLAGAYLFRIRPPRKTKENDFAISVSKQGKLFANIPGSEFEKYPSGTRNISVEAALGGAIKGSIGATTPENLSMNLNCAGGLRLELGADSVGNSLTIIHHGAIKYQHASSIGDSDAAIQEETNGVKQITVNGTLSHFVDGTCDTTVSGQHSTKADRVVVQASGGHTLNCGEANIMVSGKSQYNYALAVLENIILGGKISTILAGGRIDNIAAGAVVQNVLGGATTINCAAGAYSVAVGTGAMNLATGAGAVSMATGAGAVSIAAGAGAVAVTAGLAVNMTASTAVSMLSPQVLLGGPPAVYGLARGMPMHPPGSPSLDWLTGLPLQGCATMRSL